MIIYSIIVDMKNILKIFFSDCKKIFSNRVAVLILISISILPSLYAWFYLKSSWDPYGNTRWLKIAIVNNDQWTMFEWSYLNIWNEVVSELKQDNNIWRVFVDEEVAQEGTRLWNYYASIVIETWFSEHFSTFLDKIPQKPQLIYTVNEKVNAITPKITDAWTSTIKENIERKFIRTVNEVVMSKMNEVGLIVKNDEGNIYHFIDVVHDIKADVSNFDQKLDNIISYTKTIKNRLQTINSKLPNSYDVIDDWKNLLDNTMTLSDSTLDLLDTMPSTIKKDIRTTRSDFDSIERQVSRILDAPKSNKNQITNDIKVISWDVVKLRWKIEDNISFLTWVKSILNNLSSWNIVSWDTVEWKIALIENQMIDKAIAPIDKLINKYTSIDDRLKIISNTLYYSQDLLNNVDRTNGLKSDLSDIRDDFDDISDTLDDEIIPQFKSVLNNLYDISEKWKEKLDELENKIPGIQSDINSGIDLINSTLEKLDKLKKELPGIQSGVANVDSSLQWIKKDNIMGKFLSVALLDPDRIADFFSSPIELVEHKLFSIPNYWSSMSPFFTVLAIRVGSLLMIAMFTTRVKEAKFTKCKEIEKFFGKRLFFLTISIAQWLIVSLWEVIFLWVYVSNVWAFILTSLVCSIVFSMIAFSCVYTFWNFWKAIMIILLVLQLSWSWGTFPVEMSDPFFQTINPYLPFTYAIKAMRESIWWVIPEIFYMNLIILLWFFWIFAIVWIIIKPLIAKPISVFDNKFAESELWEE